MEYLALYSQNSPDFTSENDEILKAIDQVGTAVQNRGIWVIGRGGDRDALFEPLLQKLTEIHQIQLNFGFG